MTTRVIVRFGDRDCVRTGKAPLAVLVLLAAAVDAVHLLVLRFDVATDILRQMFSGVKRSNGRKVCPRCARGDAGYG